MNIPILYKYMLKHSTTLILLLLSFLLIALSTNSTIYSYKDPHFRYYGRTYTDDVGLRYDWPCTAIQFCFINTTQVWWLGVDKFSHYEITLNNNKSTLIIPKSQSKIPIFQTQQPTSSVNCIKITKITQDHFGPLGTHTDAVFKGIQMQGNGAQLVDIQKKYQYKFQFVGDSLTVGFGDMSGTNIKCFFRMRHNQKCTESWAHHLSQKFNAQYRIIAQSGKGVAKNAPFIFGQVMPVLITKTTSNSKPDSYHYQDKYSPDIIFVFLGVNDYNNLIKPGTDLFVYSYQKMLTQIINSQILSTGRKPKIIGLCSQDYSKIICENVEKAIKAFSYAYEHAYFVKFPAGIYVKGNMGCINHPNTKGQAKLADSIYQQVKQILEK